MTERAYVSPAIAKEHDALVRACMRRDARAVGAALADIKQARTDALRRECRAINAEKRRRAMRLNAERRAMQPATGQLSFPIVAAE